MRNELIELIAYEPQTPQVHAVPLLCSPPWINKYYIMDLAPGRSFVEWAVKHGHQTFMISYRNPDAVDVALHDGRLLARRHFGGARRGAGDHRRAEGQHRGAVLGRNAGADRAWPIWRRTARATASSRATLTNTLIDFSIPGDLGVFTDEDTIARLEKKMRERGYLESAEMARPSIGCARAI